MRGLTFVFCFALFGEGQERSLKGLLLPPWMLTIKGVAAVHSVWECFFHLTLKIEGRRSENYNHTTLMIMIVNDDNENRCQFAECPG